MNRYAAIVLAGGQGSRYRAAGGTGPTKLVATLAGVPLVRHVVEAAIASRAEPVIVVTGHAADAVAAAIQDLDVTLAHNAAYAEGLASTLQVGLAAVPDNCAGAVVLLGDMPGIGSDTTDRLIQAALIDPAADAVVATCEGVRGNPVLLTRSLWAAVATLRGDVGARVLLKEPHRRIVDVPCSVAVTWDVDQPTDLLDAAASTESKTV